MFRASGQSRFFRLFPMLLMMGGATTFPLHADLSDEQKKKRFLESQEATGSSTSSGHSSSESSKSGKHIHHTAHPSPTPHSSHIKKHTKAHSSAHPSIHPSELGKSEEKKHHAHEEAASPESPPRHATAVPKSASPSIAAAPTESVMHSQGASTAPAPELASVPPKSAPPDSALPSLPHGANPSAPIVISKSGAEQEQGLEPAPTPESSTSSSWNPFSWLFASHQSYTYLTSATRAAIDHAPVRRGRWKYIIVHNSGTREGNARVFNIYHLRVRHMKNGLAYHFVIGDGHGSGDGEIEIGHRWTAQLNGGHVASDYLNDISLGICLVGDFNRDLPTKAQIGALEELIRYLRIRVGKTQGRQSIVYAHKEINPRPTDCPGDRFPYTWLHATFGKPN